MDKFKLGLKSLVLDSNSDNGSLSGAPFSADQTRVLVRASAPGRMVSLGTCSKVCLVSFTVGVFVGFTLKRRFKRWVTKFLKHMKED